MFLLSLTEILKGCLATMDKELWIKANDSLVKIFLCSSNLTLNSEKVLKVN